MVPDAFRRLYFSDLPEKYQDFERTVESEILQSTEDPRIQVLTVWDKDEEFPVYIRATTVYAANYWNQFKATANMLPTLDVEMDEELIEHYRERSYFGGGVTRKDRRDCILQIHLMVTKGDNPISRKIDDIMELRTVGEIEE